MTYRFKSGLTALLCLAVIGPTAKPVVAQTATSLATSSQAATAPATIAKVQNHAVDGKAAATLYVRNLPILTFLSDEVANARLSGASAQLVSNFQSGQSSRVAAERVTDQNSMVRATQIATKLNQMHRQGVAADKIQVVWQANPGQYVVQVENLPIATIDASTTYAQTTRNAEQDALLVANRLRRLLGDAKPLKSVQGKPNPVKPKATVTDSPSNNPSGKPSSASTAEWTVRKVLKGEASWYGPGFNGNLTASGEVFNQNALTAAHPSLPFGTRIRVTNQNNGKSVMVRVNDRGPYAGGRIIDLSAGAAGVIGLDISGVADVKAEVLEKN
jgi:rare lipoprotein A